MNDVIIISSDNCRACEKLEINIRRLSAKAKINYIISKDPTVAAQYHVVSVPTILITPPNIPYTPIAYVIGSPSQHALYNFLKRHNAIRDR